MKSLARGLANIGTLGIKEKVEDALERKRKRERASMKRRQRLHIAYTIHDNLDRQRFEKAQQAKQYADSAERKLNEHLEKLEKRKSRIGQRSRRIQTELEEEARLAKIEDAKRQVNILNKLEESIILEKKKVEKDIKKAQSKGKKVNGTANGNNSNIASILKHRGKLGFLGLKTSHGGVKRRPVKRVVKRPVRSVRAR